MEMSGGRTLLGAVATLLTLAASAPLEGASSCADPSADSVWLVRTGGFWRAGGKFGHYRVVVHREGVEHARDRVELQVLVTDAKKGRRAVAKCTELESPGLKGHVEDVRVQEIDDKVSAVYLDISMKAMSDVVLREVFLASYRGNTDRIQEATSVDLQDVADRLRK